MTLRCEQETLRTRHYQTPQPPASTQPPSFDFAGPLQHDASKREQDIFQTVEGRVRGARAGTERRTSNDSATTGELKEMDAYVALEKALERQEELELGKVRLDSGGRPRKV